LAFSRRANAPSTCGIAATATLRLYENCSSLAERLLNPSANLTYTYSLR
jgi:hypothetical protein